MTRKNVLNKDLRRRIAQMVFDSREGHIPSSFSIVDIINYLYSSVLSVDPKDPRWPERDYFMLSKGHGAAGLYVVLHKFGFLTDEMMLQYSSASGILGGHPDRTCVPGAEASTGSLGHGLSMAVGVALGLRIQQRKNKVIALLGDGECQEGTVWEAAMVGAGRELGNLVAIIDFNGSANQILKVDPFAAKWSAFGWETYEIDGHDEAQMARAFEKMDFSPTGRPKAVIAHTVKGKGVSFMEVHGPWHHRIPSAEELTAIFEELR